MLGYLIPSALLSAFGILNILGIKTSYFPRQLVFVVFAFGAYLIIRKIGFNYFRLNIHFFYWLLVFILIFTYVFGLEIKGSKRWLDFYFFNFQGSEFFKIIFIIFLANFFGHRQRRISYLSYFLISIFYLIIPAFIILKQPDLGNATVYVFIYFSMLLLSSIPKSLMMRFIGLIVLLLPFSWIFMKEYQQHRILSFINPEIDSQGTAYNMIQAVITVGSGKFFGKGLGLGTQSRLFYLPENYTDFAFASFIEQFGFFGGVLILGLFGFLIYQLFRRIFSTSDLRDEDERVHFLYRFGFFAYFIFQVVVNIGMNLGLLPIAGIALPFISYGGSAILAIMFGMALL
jgi:rod shape determining protein RodA